MKCGLLSAAAIAWAGFARAARDIPRRAPYPPRNNDYNDVGFSEAPTPIGDVTNFTQNNDTNMFEITCGDDAIRVQFYRHDIVRVWAGWKGNFTEGGNFTGNIVVADPATLVMPAYKDWGDFYDMYVPDGEFTLRAHKSPLRLSMYRGDASLWKEAAGSGLSHNATASFQTLEVDDDEQFFGGGMQNGRFSHKGSRIGISADDNWDDGGNPNAAPFWLSSAGYGVFRNTWSNGFYDFSSSEPVLAHNETRFDAFYIGGRPRDFRGLLEGYTYLTGRPFMPPAYALGLGDSDCYHNARHGTDTHVVLAVADKYRAQNMPGTWILPNDGYGCGYGKDHNATSFPTDITVLEDVASELEKRGFMTGLWSSTGLPNFPAEVKTGVRIGKTDVGWIGDGYKYALDSCQLVADGIEQNSDNRRHIWTVSGWAGTQRLAVMWTGDDTGTWDYIRWQIPTFVGCGFSSQAHVSGDIAGIFGGSPETYTRDLQMKSMMTVLMVMSGWARNPDKQPWTWGEPFTSINRMYLQLKMRLTPYTYTLSREAHDTGYPPVRAMALEFPFDNATLVNSTGTSQQFMLGPWFLVAPVYRPLSETTRRDGIYLPEGDWVDYWNRANITTGPVILDGYDAPLERLPMFIRAGAVVPLWPEMLYVGEKKVDPLSIEVFPSGSTSFELYEDDGITRQALQGSAFARTNITCEAPTDALQRGGPVKVVVSASVGAFEGMLKKRAYDFRIQTPHAPFEVELRVFPGSLEILPQMNSLSELDFVEKGWFFVKGFFGLEAGHVVVKTPSINTSEGFSVTLAKGPHVPHIALKECEDETVNAVENQAFDYDTVTGLVTQRSNSSSCLSVGKDKDPDSGTPAVEIAGCADVSNPDLAARQRWTFTEDKNLKLRSDGSTCVDFDRTVRLAEMYSCGSPAQVNQMWSWDNETGRIVALLDSSCFTPTYDALSRPRVQEQIGIVV